MVSRKNLKNSHEEAVLRHFKAYLESKGITLQVLERPDPPEAIVEIDGEKTWIEITDAYLDKAHAISLTTSASDNVKNIPDIRRRILEPDGTFSSVLHSVIEVKYGKKSMLAIAATQGPGILLVGIFTPFTTAEAVAHDEAVTVVELASRMPTKVFKTIYAYDGTGQRRFHVLYHHEA